MRKLYGVVVTVIFFAMNEPNFLKLYRHVYIMQYALSKSFHFSALHVCKTYRHEHLHHHHPDLLIGSAKICMID